MIEKIRIPQHAEDYAAAILVVLIQNAVMGSMNNFIEATFGTARFVPIIIPLLSVITYSLYFGNSRLSFIVGFLSTMVPQLYFIFFLSGLDFVLRSPQSFIGTVVLGVLFGLIGMLLSIFKKNTVIAIRISIHAVLLMSLLGIPAILRSMYMYGGQVWVFWFVFNSALILELLLSYLILHDAKKAFIFTLSALIMTFLLILITPLYGIIFSGQFFYNDIFFGVIIAIILGAILKVYTYYQAHKTRG